MISEVVENLLPLVLDFLSTEGAEEWWALIFHCLCAKCVLVVEIGELKLPDGFYCEEKIAL